MRNKKRYFLKALLLVGVIIALPFMVIMFNSVISLFLNRTYKPIDNRLSTAHFMMVKVASGKFENYYPATGFVDTISGDKAIRVLNGNVEPARDDEPGGYVYFDTVKYQFKLQLTEYVASKKNPETDDPVTHYLTFDRKAKIISDVPDSNMKAIVNLKNCINLKDVIKSWQKWSDKSNVIYITHFSEEDFVLPTFNLYPVDSSSPHCYWTGYGYYNIKEENETLKFKIPCQSRALLWTTDDDLETGLSFYLLPERYRNKLDVKLLVYADGNRDEILYMIARK